jgi:5-bromo-4-chloroindolyl phosphate hydrolysis protein
MKTFVLAVALVLTSTAAFAFSEESETGFKVGQKMGDALYRESLICRDYGFKRGILEAAEKMGGVQKILTQTGGVIKIKTGTGRYITIQPGAGCAVVED